MGSLSKREEGRSWEPVMLREFLSEKYHKDDQIVSKHVEGSSVWKSRRPAAPAVVTAFVNTWVTSQSTLSHFADHAKLRQVQAQD